MKKSLVIIFLMLVGVAATVFGQMNSGAPGERQHRHSGSAVVALQKDVTDDQKMNQETKQNVTGMMKQMNEIMQKMTDTFENKVNKESRNLPVLGKMMRELSLQISEMAAVIEKGKLDPQTLTNMQARMESVNKRIDAIQ